MQAVREEVRHRVQFYCSACVLMEVRPPTTADITALAHAVAALDFFKPQNDPAQLAGVWQRAQAQGDKLLAVYEEDKPLGLCQF